MISPSTRATSAVAFPAASTEDDLGIEIDGERIALLPVLSSLLARLRDPGQPGELDALAHNGTVFGRLPDGRHVALPLERTRAIIAMLIELYDPKKLSADGKLAVSAGEITGIAAVEALMQLRRLGGERLRALAQRLSSFSGIEKIEPPAADRGRPQDSAVLAIHQHARPDQAAAG